MPFYRWLDLQQHIRATPTWTRVGPDISGVIVEAATTPWDRPLWVAIYRKRVQHRTATNFQLDLFDPNDGHDEYSAITSNLRGSRSPTSGTSWRGAAATRRPSRS